MQREREVLDQRLGSGGRRAINSWIRELELGNLHRDRTFAAIVSSSHFFFLVPVS
jgi:hypothetical protein